MSNGAEQFLGRQLVNVTKALQDLVTDNIEMLTALENMKTAIESTIPKYTIVSDNLKHSKLGNIGTIKGGATEESNLPYSFVPFLSGSIRVTITGQANNYMEFEITNNGLSVGANGITGTQTRTFDINVKEGDVLSFRAKGGSTSYYIILTDLKISYDLVTKPNMSL